MAGELLTLCGYVSFWIIAVISWEWVLRPLLVDSDK